MKSNEKTNLPLNFASTKVEVVSRQDKFNQQVEADLVFIYSFVIFHLIDRCTRWHSAVIIPDRSTETLIAALDKEWVSVH